MEKIFITKKKIAMTIFSVMLLIVIGYFYLDYSANPENKYRAEGTSYTANKIIIDDFYTVDSYSNTFVQISYNDSGNSNSITKSYGESIEKVGWDENFIAATGRSDSLGDGPLRYFIINRETTEYKIYENKKDFEKTLNELDVEVELKGREYYDWY
ncbi:hypothetical protein ACEN4P_05155 [Marinilactibacillus psychrotolerans]|uniref:hypothetical protein n=1 Tax=Marinilactibacillus psychrotolerans TaxID=191770 RepID=UPI001C7D76A3|nr:hypothetical protein [Marinilactibacillus psychrotolerans]GEQ32833.1 hypothetical protein B795N_07150 [Marinilactibacillus psychrotolerans]